MKRLLIAILVLSGLWFSYWFIGAASMRTGVQGWFEARRADGWVADYSEMAVRGFPNRLDVFLTNPVVADPDSGLAWQADKLDILALSYRRNHMIAVFPPQQMVSTPFGKYVITHDDMRASLVVDTAREKAVMRANLVGDALRIKSDRQDGISARQLRAAITELGDAPNSYRIAVVAEDLRPPLPYHSQLAGKATLPDTFETARADISVTFDAPWDRHAVDSARPQPRKIDITLAEAKWGELLLQLAGSLDVDRQGVPTGRLVVKARNWREILGLVRAQGSVPPSVLDGLETALSLAAGLSGNKHTLDLPLDFRGGRIFLGPAPIGTAPRIQLR